MSTTPSVDTVTNDLPGSAKWPMHASTSSGEARATSAISASGVGRAHLAVVVAKLGDALEHQLGDGARAVALELEVGLVGVAGQRVVDAAAGLVVLEVDGALARCVARTRCPTCA